MLHDYVLFLICAFSNVLNLSLNNMPYREVIMFFQWIFGFKSGQFFIGGQWVGNLIWQHEVALWGIRKWSILYLPQNGSGAKWTLAFVGDEEKRSAFPSERTTLEQSNPPPHSHGPLDKKPCPSAYMQRTSEEDMMFISLPIVFGLMKDALFWFTYCFLFTCCLFVYMLFNVYMLFLCLPVISLFTCCSFIYMLFICLHAVCLFTYHPCPDEEHVHLVCLLFICLHVVSLFTCCSFVYMLFTYCLFVYMLFICLPIIPALMKDVLFWFAYFSLDVNFPRLPSSRSVTRMTSETLLMKIRKRCKNRRYTSTPV